jgi:hypothetical protein
MSLYEGLHFGAVDWKLTMILKIVAYTYIYAGSISSQGIFGKFPRLL